MLPPYSCICCGTRAAGCVTLEFKTNEQYPSPSLSLNYAVCTRCRVENWELAGNLAWDYFLSMMRDAIP